MNSIEFFDNPNISNKQALDWGTGYLQNEKVDPTVMRGPTFILKY